MGKYSKTCPQISSCISTGVILTSLLSTWWAMGQRTGLNISPTASSSLIFFKVCPDLPTMPVAQWNGSQGGVRVCGVQVSIYVHTSELVIRRRLEHFFSGVAIAIIGTRQGSNDPLPQGDILNKAS